MRQKHAYMHTRSCLALTLAHFLDFTNQLAYIYSGSINKSLPSLLAFFLQVKVISLIQPTVLNGKNINIICKLFNQMIAQTTRPFCLHSDIHPVLFTLPCIDMHTHTKHMHTPSWFAHTSTLLSDFTDQLAFIVAVYEQAFFFFFFFFLVTRVKAILISQLSCVAKPLTLQFGWPCLSFKVRNAFSHKFWVSVWMKFSMLPQPVGLLLNLAKIIFNGDNCWHFMTYTLSIITCQDTCEPICFQLGVMLNSTVWMTLMFTQGYRER